MTNSEDWLTMIVWVSLTRSSGTLPTWGSHDHEWETRAIERAANTVAWALLLDNPRPYEPFHSHLCSYESLKGNALTQSLAAPCPAADHSKNFFAS